MSGKNSLARVGQESPNQNAPRKDFLRKRCTARELRFAEQGFKMTAGEMAVLGWMAWGMGPESEVEIFADQSRGGRPALRIEEGQGSPDKAIPRSRSISRRAVMGRRA